MQVRMSNKTEATWHGLPKAEWDALVQEAARRIEQKLTKEKDTNEQS
jgi:hypothetical protein